MDSSDPILGRQLARVMERRPQPSMNGRPRVGATFCQRKIDDKSMVTSEHSSVPWLV